MPALDVDAWMNAERAATLGVGECDIREWLLSTEIGPVDSETGAPLAVGTIAVVQQHGNKNRSQDLSFRSHTGRLAADRWVWLSAAARFTKLSPTERAVGDLRVSLQAQFALMSAKSTGYKPFVHRHELFAAVLQSGDLFVSRLSPLPGMGTSENGVLELRASRASDFHRVLSGNPDPDPSANPDFSQTSESLLFGIAVRHFQSSDILAGNNAGTILRSLQLHLTY